MAQRIFEPIFFLKGIDPQCSYLHPITEKQSPRLQLNKSIIEGEEMIVVAPELIFSKKKKIK
jgi:hypothetical protein